MPFKKKHFLGGFITTPQKNSFWIRLISQKQLSVLAFFVKHLDFFKTLQEKINGLHK